MPQHRLHLRPLLRGLRVLEKQERNPTLKRILGELALAIPLLYGWRWALASSSAALALMAILTFLWWCITGGVNFLIHMGYPDCGYEEDRPWTIRKWVCGPFYLAFTYLLGLLEPYVNCLCHP